MSKHDYPPLRMIIEGGKLVPATPFDSERIDSYRRGTVVNVRFTEDKDRVLVRKWWAVLGLAIKQCETPWKTKDEASEAIKLALGIVNLSKTVSGQWMQYPKSLTELDDPEMTEALDQMMELLHRITGVDPDTLRKEAGNVGEQAKEIQDTPDGEAAGSPSDAAPADANSSSPASASAQPDTELLIKAFRQLWAARGPDDSVVDNQARAMKGDFADANEATTRKAKTIKENIKFAGKGVNSLGQPYSEGDCIKYLAGVIGVEPADLLSP